MGGVPEEKTVASARTSLSAGAVRDAYSWVTCKVPCQFKRPVPSRRPRDRLPYF